MANRDIKLDNILLQANNNPNGRPLLKLCGAPTAYTQRGVLKCMCLDGSCWQKCAAPQPTASADATWCACNTRTSPVAHACVMGAIIQVIVPIPWGAFLC